MHLDIEAIELYAAGQRVEEAALHLVCCERCRRRLARVEKDRAHFTQHVLPRSFTKVEGVRLLDWFRLRSITQGIRVAVSYDARR